MLRFVVCEAESNLLWRCRKFAVHGKVVALERSVTAKPISDVRECSMFSHGTLIHLSNYSEWIICDCPRIAFNWDKHCVGSRISECMNEQKTNYEWIAGNEIIIAHHIQQQRLCYNWLQSRTRYMRQWLNPQPAAAEEEEEHKKQLRVDVSTAMSHVATT